MKSGNWFGLKERRDIRNGDDIDIYKEQELERSVIDKPESPAWRLAVTALAGIGTFIVVFLIAGLFWMGSDFVGSVATSGVGSSASSSSLSNEERDLLSQHEKDENGVSIPSYVHVSSTGVPGLANYKPGYQQFASEDRTLPAGPIYDRVEDVPKPQWYIDIENKAKADDAQAKKEEQARKSGKVQDNGVWVQKHHTTPQNLRHYLLTPTWWKLLLALVAGLAVTSIVYALLMKNLQAQNALSDVSDINQHDDDRHIQLPMEVLTNYDVFPDVGAHSDVSPNALLSHAALSAKGIKHVDIAERVDKDIIGADGQVESYRGEVIYNDDGSIKTRSVPFIDEKFGQALFAASEAPVQYRTTFDPKKIKYNPGDKNRDKLKGYNTVADLINNEWEFPLYETQVPAGIYVVDTAPVNVMVLAITRAGKGQTIIEPTIDMWSREKNPQNMVINDPKGELLVKFYVPFAVRGFDIIQFNLINVMKTDIYNPLAMASEAAREKDFTSCAAYVGNIADVFFPIEGSEDPVWPNAANNAFKRAAYGLIDFYLEEEIEYRTWADSVGQDTMSTENYIDSLWGNVSLYNCYQLFVQLSAKTKNNPADEIMEKAKNREFDELRSTPEGQLKFQKMCEDANEQSTVIWNGESKKDLLTLYFDATDLLPHNDMRDLVDNANKSLQSMGGAEKMLASVYSIAITAMSFFTDPRIRTMTSGTLSQSVDLAGISFPRRFGVRLNANFVSRWHLVGYTAVWQGYEDQGFTKSLGEDFHHEDMVSAEGWAKCYIKGAFENDVSYLRLELRNAKTRASLHTFYFRFTKAYALTYDHTKFINEPISGDKIVKNGYLEELVKAKDKHGNIVFVNAKKRFKTKKIVGLSGDDAGNASVADYDAPAVAQTLIRYSEKPKAIFLVTPPHLMQYAKLLLILVKQMVDLNFEQSYMTKSNQKPLYRTRFMFDELGNFQSEGHGINGFQTMLSIGLGQDQLFTLILQTLQQLRDVYGDSVDAIIKGNTADIIYLKSTDDVMLDTLEKMSGKTNKVYKDSKSVTKALNDLIMPVEGKVTYTMTTRDVPVISFNKLFFMKPRQSVVFRAGDDPMWSRNQLILPMSWRMFNEKEGNKIINPGEDYSLQTIPSTSTAADFDVRLNMPDFGKMFEKRFLQATKVKEAEEAYKKMYDVDDNDIMRLDPDTYADEIMEIINSLIRMEKQEALEESDENVDEEVANEFDVVSNNPNARDIYANLSKNDELDAAMAEQKKLRYDNLAKRYCDHLVCRADLVNNGIANHQLDRDIIEAYRDSFAYMAKDTEHFSMVGDNLCSVAEPGHKPVVYIRKLAESKPLTSLKKSSIDADSKVYSDIDSTGEDAQTDGFNEAQLKNYGQWVVEDSFYKFLVSLDKWDFAQGQFERSLVEQFNKVEESTLHDRMS